MNSNSLIFFLASFSFTQYTAVARPSSKAPPAPPVVTKDSAFQPPDERDIPQGVFGDMIRDGREIFIHTGQNAAAFVGNHLRCVNCHLDKGRQANSAPLWAAYVMYPAFRAKTNKVDSIEERIQGCFMYSMNGTAPAFDSKEMKALVAYHYWLATGAKTGVELPGRGFPRLPPPERTPTFEAGEKLYVTQCIFCHGKDGQGVNSGDETVIPPLWGANSYNWGSGMHCVNTAASFIKANMPLGRGGSLSDQEAWDLAYFVNSHERPQDPRFQGSIAETFKAFHRENCRYGNKVYDRVLGSQPTVFTH